MKKQAFILFLSAITMSVFGQTHADALRYSQPTIGGTARSVAMGGAFGALGGDFSSLSGNPAGIAVYRKSEFTFTPEFYTSKTNARFNGTEVGEKNTNFNFSNLGFVATVEQNNGILKAVNFGFGFNRIANFHKNTTINGVNMSSSLGDYMAADANTYGLGTFSSALFYDADVIRYDPDFGYFLNDSIDEGYFDELGNFYPVEQKEVREESGRISERTFSVGVNLSNVLYLGATFGWHKVIYNSESMWYEYDAELSDFQYFDYEEKIAVTGDGYTAKIGAIFTPFKTLRVGLAYHTPVYYSLDEEYITSISSRYIGWQVYYPIDEYGDDIDYLESSYTVKTPAKVTASVASVIGNFLILSADLDYVNYSDMKMKPSSDFDDQNVLIKEVYSDAVNIRMGGELKLGKTYLRAGAGFNGSAYAVDEENNDAYQVSYTGGIGFRDDNFFIDIAYQYVNYDERNVLYDVIVDGGYYAPTANIDNKNTRLMTTVGFRF